MRTFGHWLVCVIVCLSGTLIRAVELTGPVQTTTTESTATIQWRTDVECGTRLQYGQTAAALDRKAEGAVTREHTIKLEALTPATTYYFSVGSARTRLAGGSFTTAGAAAAAATPQPSLVRRVLDVIAPGKKDREQTDAAAKAPSARETWGHLDSLQDHYDRHGRDFGSKSPEEYAAQAWRFLQRARTEDLPMKLDRTDGTLRVFDPATGVFGAYNNAGRTKTFFKPGSASYWQRQPGQTVKATHLRLFER